MKFIINLYKTNSFMMRSFSLLIAVMALASATQAQKIGCSVTDKHRTLPGQKIHINGIDTTKTRGLADNYYLWDNGQTLKVKFLSGSKMLQDRVTKLAKVWETHANIKFNFVKPDEEAHIRVMLGTGEGHYSFIGMVSKLIPGDEQTMALDTLDLGDNMAAWQRTVQHEFGHAIGLLHEHSSPVSGINWDKKKMYAHYAKMGWTKDDVDAQVFASYAVSYTNGTKYDNKSIMHYPILAWQTTDGYAVPWNSAISEGDKSIIKMLYPKTGDRLNEVPRYSFDNYTKLNAVKNDAKGGVSFFPGFDITASGAAGKVYFSVLFFDAEGYGIEDKDGNYAYGSTVAAVRTVNMTSGQKLSNNKNGGKDFELFIPYSEIHVPDGMHEFWLEFRVVQVTEEGEIKYIYQSDVEKFKLNKKPVTAAQNSKSNAKPAAKKKG
jgi:serralysin